MTYVRAIGWLLPIALLASCSRNVPDPEFKINNVLIYGFPKDSMPKEPFDSLAVLHVYVGDTVFIEDVTEPVKGIKKRLWDTDGDGTYDKEGLSFIQVVFEEPGITSITLCLNGTEYCETRYVVVDEAIAEEDIEPETESEPEPIKPIVKVPRPDDADKRRQRPSPPDPLPAPIVIPAVKGEKKLVNKDFVGLSLRDLSSYADCSEKGATSISTSLNVKSLCELLSFNIFTDNCGMMVVNIKGPGNFDESDTFILSQGKNQISIGEMGALEPGVYTMSIKTAKGGTCPHSAAPKLIDASKCPQGTGKNSTSTLSLDQNGASYIYELKFLH